MNTRLQRPSRDPHRPHAAGDPRGSRDDAAHTGNGARAPRNPRPAAAAHDAAVALHAGADGAEWVRAWVEQALLGVRRSVAWWEHAERLNAQMLAAWSDAARAAARELESADSVDELAAVPARYVQHLWEVALRRSTDLANAASEAEKHWMEEARCAALGAAQAWSQDPVRGWVEPWNVLLKGAAGVAAVAPPPAPGPASR